MIIIIIIIVMIMIIVIIIIIIIIIITTAILKKNNNYSNNNSTKIKNTENMASNAGPYVRTSTFFAEMFADSISPPLESSSTQGTMDPKKPDPRVLGPENDKKNVF